MRRRWRCTCCSRGERRAGSGEILATPCLAQRPAGLMPLLLVDRRGGGMLAWDSERAAAALGPAFSELLKAAGSKAMREGLAALPDVAVTGEPRACIARRAGDAEPAR